VLEEERGRAGILAWEWERGSDHAVEQLPGHFSTFSFAATCECGEHHLKNHLNENEN
jgi:hypothetical protein